MTRFSQILLPMVVVVLPAVPAGSAVAAALTLDAAVEVIATSDWDEAALAVAVVDEHVRQAQPGSAEMEALETALLQIVTGDAAFAAKRYACQRLALVGSGRSAAVLADLLADAQMAHLARFALERIADEKVDEVLVGTLERVAGDQKAAVVHALGERGCDVAMLARLCRDEHETVALAAVTALGKAHDPAALDVLVTLEGSPALRDAVNDGYLRHATRAVQTGRTQAAVDIYQRLYRESKLPRMREAGLLGLIAAQPQRAKKLLAEVLRRGDEPLQQAAGRVMTDWEEDALVRHFSETLARLPAVSQVTVLSAIGQRQYRAAHAQVVTALAAESAGVQAAAVAALGRIGGAADVTRLAEKTVAADEVVAATAVRTLEGLSGVGVDQALVDVCATAPTEVQSKLLEVLTLRRASEALSLAVTLSESEDDDVRKEALSLLGDLGGADEVAALVGVLQRTSRSKWQRRIADALQKIVGRDAEAVGAVAAGYEEGSDKVRAALVGVLPAAGTDEALAALRAAGDDDSERVQRAVIGALAEWKGPETLADLLELARTGDKENLRILAFRGYVRQVRQQPMSGPERLAALAAVTDVAQRDAEKRLLIAALPEAGGMAAVRWAQDYRGEEALVAEATLAVLQMAEPLLREHGEELKPIIAEVGATVTDEQMKAWVANLLDRIERNDERLAREWTFFYGTENWQAANDCALAVVDGALQVTVRGGDPFFTTAPNVPGGKMVVQMLVKAGPTEAWQVFWGTDTKALAEAPIWTTNFLVAASEDGWEEVNVPIVVDGMLTELRIDPGQSHRAILLDRITLLYER